MKSTPSLLAMLGLVAVAGYQILAKIGEMIADARRRQPCDGATPQSGFLSGITNLFNSNANGAGTLSSGLGDLMNRFTAAGHDSTAQSWVTTGSNPPLEVQEIAHAIGDEALDDFARKTGLPRVELIRFLTAFHHTLQDIYFAENALVRALPEVAAAERVPDFKALVQAHLTETKALVDILDKVFATINQKLEGTKCDVIKGLIKETAGLKKVATGVALDATLIAAAQAVEHCEIARYGTLREWARLPGNTEAHDLLGQILDMEKAANSKLTGLAVMQVNTKKAA